MSSDNIFTVQVKPLPVGTAEYESKRQALDKNLASKIPAAYRLPQSVITNPPQDVTGIPRSSGILTDKELDITENYNATKLASKIADKTFTAVEVATAYAKRAAIAHQLTCCLVDYFEDEAIERARSLDEHLEHTGKTVGPLHGVPVSIKDHVPVAGHASAQGFICTIEQDKADCLIVEILRSAGAVPYVKTNQPQAIMHLESESCRGRTLNPHNINLSSGGSTGGEAALLAMKGSVLGIGTDIGGSIRQPAGVCGIYGYKPTSWVLTTKDTLRRGTVCELNILGVIGPMARSVDDLDLFCKVILDSKPYLRDPRLVPTVWRGLSAPPVQKPLKVGILLNDGAIQPQPPVVRALEWAQAKLSASPGFKDGSLVVKPFAPYKAAQAVADILRLYWADGGELVEGALKAGGEPEFPLTTHVLSAARHKPQDWKVLMENVYERDEFRAAFAQHWTEQDVDVVICPVFVGPAPAHDTARHWNYTAFWNYVDYPAAVFPTPVVTEKGEQYRPEFSEPLSEACKEVRKLWDQTDFTGAPIDLQVVARRYHDNELFSALSVLKTVLDLP